MRIAAGVHGVFDETNQTRGAAASDQGAFPSRASVMKEESSRKDTILVPANPKFADLIPVFLQNCRQNVIAMLNALDRGDFETVEILGHGMRGAGGSYGFQAITDIGAALEQAAESATPTRRASGWANCPGTWIVSRSSPTSRHTITGAGFWRAGADACGELRDRKRLGHIVRHPSKPARVLGSSVMAVSISTGRG